LLLVEIYIATFAGLLSTLLLAFVYLADRYEREVETSPGRDRGF
jgi:hypothetical protein